MDYWSARAGRYDMRWQAPTDRRRQTPARTGLVEGRGCLLGRPTAIIELRDNTPSRAARLAIERHGDLVEALLVERERAARPSQP